MSTLQELYGSLSPELKDWLDKNIELLDSSLTDFAEKFYNDIFEPHSASVPKSNNSKKNDEWLDRYHDIQNFLNLMVMDDFCGLSVEDAYHTIAHDERRIVETSYIPTFNHELGMHKMALPQKLDRLVRDFSLDNFRKLSAVMGSDTGREWSIYSRDIGVPVIGTGHAYLKDLKHTDWWIALKPWRPIEDPSLSAKLKFSPPPGYITACMYMEATKTGLIVPADMLAADLPSKVGRKEGVVFVPAKKFSTTGRNRVWVRTWLSEQLVDEFGLPKADF